MSLIEVVDALSSEQSCMVLLESQINILEEGRFKNYLTSKYKYLEFMLGELTVLHLKWINNPSCENTKRSVYELQGEFNLKIGEVLKICLNRTNIQHRAKSLARAD